MRPVGIPIGLPLCIPIGLPVGLPYCYHTVYPYVHLMVYPCYLPSRDPRVLIIDCFCDPQILMQIELTKVKTTEAINATLDSHRSFIETLMTNLAPKYSSLLLSCLSDPCGLNHHIPIVTSIILSADDIVLQSNRAHGNKVVTRQMLSSFLNMFIQTRTETLPEALYYIPKFNLHHFGNICHLNTCLLMLASMYHLLKAINDLPAESVTLALSILNTVLVSSYSPVDMNPTMVYDLVQILQLNPNETMPAEETICQLVNIFEPVIPKSIVLAWDYAHTCLPDPADTDSNLETIVNKYSPKYLLVNAQDFNVEMRVPQNDQFIPKYGTTQHTYKLASVIIHIGAHFMNIFMRGNECIIKDDLYHRYRSPDRDVNHLGRYQVTEVCYVRIDEA